MNKISHADIYKMYFKQKNERMSTKCCIIFEKFVLILHSQLLALHLNASFEYILRVFTILHWLIGT